MKASMLPGAMEDICSIQQKGLETIVPAQMDVSVKQNNKSHFQETKAKSEGIIMDLLKGGCKVTLFFQVVQVYSNVKEEKETHNITDSY